MDPVQVTGTQNIQDTTNTAAAAQGAQPAYIQNINDVTPSELGGDTTTINAANVNTNSNAAANNANGVAGANNNAGGNYIINFPAGGAVEVGSTYQDIYSSLDSTVEGFDEDSYISTDANGYQRIDYSSLQTLHRRVSAYCAILSMIEMLQRGDHSARDLVMKEMWQVEGYKGLDTQKIVQKEVENRMKKVNVSTAELIKEVNDFNEAKYEADLAAIENDYKDREPAWSDGACGGDSEADIAADKAGDQEAATSRYRQACDANAAGSAALFNASGLLVGSGSADDINTLVNNMAADILSDFSHIEHDSTNGYSEVDSASLVAMRSGLNACFNAKKLNAMVKGSFADSRSIVHQEMTGIGSAEANKATIEGLMEEESSYAMGVFDTAANDRVRATQIHNQEIYLDKQEQKYLEMAKSNGGMWKAVGSILGVIAAICAVAIPVWGLLIGAVVGLIASECSAYGSHLQAEDALAAEENCNDAYTPTNYQPTANNASTSTGNSALDAYNGAGNAQNNLNSGIYATNPNATYIHTGNDGYTSVDDPEIANQSRLLNRLANVQRAISAVYKEESSNRNIVHMEMTGVGSRETSELVSGIVESDIAQKQSVFTTAVYNIRQQNMSRNIANQKSRNLDTLRDNVNNSNWGFIPWVGPLITNFMTIGAQKDMYDDSLNQTFTSDHLEVTQAGTSGADEIDAMEQEEYLALINNPTIDSGDGNVAANTTQINTTRDNLTHLFNLREAINSVNKAKSEFRNLVHLEMTGVRGRSSGDLVTAVNRGKFENSMQIMRLLETYITSQVEVANRANSAQQQTDKLNNQNTTDWAILIVMIVVGACTGSWSSFLACFNLISPLMSVANAVINYNFYKDRSEAEYGASRNNIAGVVQSNNPDSTQAELDRQEQEALNEISFSLMQSTTNGLWGVNTGLTAHYSNLIDRIYNIRKAIASVRKSASDARNQVHATMTGVAGRSANYGLTQLANAQTAALAAVETLFARLDVIASRHNAMSKADREATLAAYDIAFAAVNLAISIAMTVAANASNEPKKDPDGQPVKGLDGKPETNMSESTFHSWQITQAALQSFILPMAQAMVKKYVGEKIDKNAKDAADKEVGGAPVINRASSASSGTGWAASVNNMENNSINYQIDSGAQKLSLGMYAEEAEKNREEWQYNQSMINTTIDYAGKLGTTIATDINKGKISELRESSVAFRTTENIINTLQNPLSLLKPLFPSSSQHDAAMDTLATLKKDLKNLSQRSDAVHTELAVNADRPHNEDPEVKRLIAELEEAKKLPAAERAVQVSSIVSQLVAMTRKELESSPNSSNTIAYADKLIGDMQTALTEADTAVKNEIKTIEQDKARKPEDTKDLKELRRLLQEAVEELNGSRRELGEAKKAYQRVSNAENEAAVLHDRVDNMFMDKKTGILAQVDELSARIAALTKLQKEQSTPANKKAIQVQIAKLEKQLNGLRSSYALARTAVDAAESNITTVKTEKKAAKEAVDRATANVGKAQQKIQKLQKEISAVTRKLEDRKKKGTAKGPMVVTPSVIAGTRNMGMEEAMAAIGRNGRVSTEG